MAKGGSFELEMCKEFSLWWSGGYRKDIFRRGRRGHRGDMTYRLPEGKLLIDSWNIECKSGYSRTKKEEKKKRIFNWCILDFIDGKRKNPQFQVFWDQCTRDADFTNREPILVFRRPFMEPCICFRQPLWKDIMEECGPPPGMYVMANVIGETIYIINLREFFDWAKDDDLTGVEFRFITPKLVKRTT